jgi:hypothetical protein
MRRFIIRDKQGLTHLSWVERKGTTEKFITNNYPYRTWTFHCGSTAIAVATGDTRVCAVQCLVCTVYEGDSTV